MQTKTHESPDSGADGAAPGRSPRGVPWLRWAPLAVVVIGLAIGYALGLHHYLSLDALRGSEGHLTRYVEEHAALAALAYLVIYAAAVAFSFPGASFLTVAGGFLFGAFIGTLLAWCGATVGATAIFLAARTSLGHLLAERAGPRIRRLQQGFQEEGFGYLLFLRLVPAFPFWVINLAAGLFGMRLATYVLATAIGILPATFVFSYFGQGLRKALASEGSPLSIELIVGLVLLGVLALVPVLVRRWRRGRESEREPES